MFPGLRPGLSSPAPSGREAQGILRRMATTLLSKSRKTSEVFWYAKSDLLLSDVSCW